MIVVFIRPFLRHRDRAKRLANSISSHHSCLSIGPAVAAMLSIFDTLTGKTPKFLSKGQLHRIENRYLVARIIFILHLIIGGSIVEDLALQNVQVWLRSTN